MKKVIIKCKVASRERLVKRLDEIEMKFSEVYWLHDRIYVPRGYKKGMNLPRLIMRTEMKAVDKPAKYKMILKRHIEDSGVDVVEETPVGDYIAAAKIILQLGFKPLTEVARRRQELRLGDGVMMYIDNIDGNKGQFVKLESELMEGESVEELQKDLASTLAVLGENNIVDTAYADLDFS